LFILLLGVIRRLELNLISEQKGEHILVAPLYNCAQLSNLQNFKLGYFTNPPNFTGITK